MYIYIINNNIDVNNMIHFKENEKTKDQKTKVHNQIKNQ